MHMVDFFLAPKNIFEKSNRTFLFWMLSYDLARAWIVGGGGRSGPTPKIKKTNTGEIKLFTKEINLFGKQDK